MAQLGVVGLVDVNLGARLTQVPDNPNTRYAYIQGSIIEHALCGFQTDDPRRDCTRIVRGSTEGCGFIRGLKIPQKFSLIKIIIINNVLRRGFI